MNEIRINPFEVTKEINIGYQYDHNATKVLFDGLEEDNYYLKLQDRQTYQAFPIPEKSWTVTYTYTQQTLLTAQIFRKVDDELIAHTPKFRMSLKSSLPQSETIKEVVPPNFQTAYDNMVNTTKDIKTKLENGEFNGQDGYSPTVQITPIDNGNKVSITDKQGTKSFDVLNGNKGDKGDNGKSAYQVAVENGFQGTEEEWLESLKGKDATTDYNYLQNKPMINGVELVGNKTSEELNIKASSDNKLIGTVSKQLNPNITDCYPNNFMNLKLYGQSTQGADPSPTNPQPITAINEFSGAVTGDNMFNPNSTDTVSTEVYNAIIVNPLNAQITVSIIDNDTSVDITGISLGVSGSTEYFDALTWMITSNTNVRTKTTKLKCITYYPKTQETLQKLLQRFNIKVEFGATATPYTPYVSQPFTYTPTNPMYSTQDGSICDYVDVEKGVEVYNMSGEVVFDGSDDEEWVFDTFYDTHYVVIKPKNLFMNSAYLQIFCDKFECHLGSVNSSEGQKIINSNGIFITRPDANNVQEWRERLSQNPITVVYQLTTPTEIPINPIQLAILRALYTYNGVTNFLCNAPVSFDYEQSLQIVINNIWNAIGQTNANILLGGNQ